MAKHDDLDYALIGIISLLFIPLFPLILLFWGFGKLITLIPVIRNLWDDF